MNRGFAFAMSGVLVGLLLSVGSTRARAGATVSYLDLSETPTVMVQGIPNPNDYQITPPTNDEGWSVTIKNALLGGFNPGLVGVYTFLEPIFENPRQPVSDAVYFDVIGVNNGGPQDLKITFVSDANPSPVPPPGNTYGSAVESGGLQFVPLPPDLLNGNPWYPGGPVPDGLSVFVASDVTTPEPSTLALAALGALVGVWRVRRRNRRS